MQELWVLLTESNICVSQACISKDVVKNSRSLFNMLKEELTLRARKKGCQDVQEIVTLKEAKSILYNLIDLVSSLFILAIVIIYYII